MNIVRLIETETAGLGQKVAVIDGGHEITYAVLLGAARAAAGALMAEGVRPYDRVALVGDNSAEYIALSLGALQIPAAIVPISPDHTHAEIDAVVNELDARVILVCGSSYNPPGSRPFQLQLPTGRGCGIAMREARGNMPREYAALDPAFIRFSSGTTGQSKGVVLSHRSIIERTDQADQGLRVTEKDTVIWVLSMSFHFVVTILLFLRRGASIYICGSQFVESVRECMRKHHGTFLYAAPVHYAMLSTSPAAEPEMLRGLRLAVSTTAQLPLAVAEAFSARFGFRPAEAYGIIEVGLPFINGADGPVKPGSVGKCLPGYVIKIENPDESGAGEVLLRGPGMFDAYFSPWRLRAEALENGWFRTGDIGRLDKDGYLAIVGRSKAVINYTGMKIFPQEIEEVVNSYPGVAESIVYGEEHSRFGQLPMARIVLKPGVESIDTDAIRKFCYRSLAAYKVPKGFEIVAEIPRTKSGKIIRR